MYNRSSSQKLSILKHVEGTQISTISIIGNPVKNVNWEESYPELAITHSHSGFTSQLILCLHMLILLYMLILLNTLIRLRYMMVLYYAAVRELVASGSKYIFIRMRKIKIYIITSGKIPLAQVFGVRKWAARNCKYCVFVL